ncbi:hypothetical protein G7046_g2490 [Stylonectria norvegica]|nr:hypothetical protein G7046_g2490 [Stylonectria norvegica]
MRAVFAFSALAASVVDASRFLNTTSSAVHSATTIAQSTTSTIYTTQLRTVISCPSDVPNCPNKQPQVVTETIAISTTVCPVTAVTTPEIKTTTEDQTATTPLTTHTTLTSLTTESASEVSHSTASSTFESSSPATSSTASHSTETSNVETSTAETSSAETSSAETSVAKTSPVETSHASSPASTSLAPSTSEQSATTTLGLTTSTIYTTTLRTVTSCAPDISDCPRTPYVTTETIALSTTVCPVTKAHRTSLTTLKTVFTSEASQTTGTSSGALNTTPVSTSETSGLSHTSDTTGQTSSTSKTTQPTESTFTTAKLTTSTVYTTTVRTITSCAPDVSDCPGKPHVTTETIAISTTVCPVTETQLTETSTLPTKLSTDTEAVPTSTHMSISHYSSQSSQVLNTTSAGSTHTQASGSQITESTISKSETTATSQATPPTSLSSTKSADTSATLTTPKLSTSTIYTTTVRTISTCAPEVDDCPGKPYITTETIAISTTVCPVTETSSEKSQTSTQAFETTKAQSSIPQTLKPSHYHNATSPAPATTTPETTSLPHTTKTAESPSQWTTSTVYTTTTRSITSCAPEVTNCPGSPETPYLTTETIAISTTVCPVSAGHQPTQQPHPGTQKWSTSTLYSTTIRTVTSCAPEITDCPGTPEKPHVTTETIAVSTTICPVTAEHQTTQQPNPGTQKWSTSTLYSTTIRTVTSCAPEITDCPGTPEQPHVTTETIAVSTTICPVTEKLQPTLPHQTAASEWTTSTVYSTAIRTITSCLPEVTNCPGSPSKPHVTTETIAIYTTVCPVTQGATRPSSAAFHSTKTILVPPHANTTIPMHTAATTASQVGNSNVTSTLYTTLMYTISSCAVNKPHCTVGGTTTTVYATGTTCIPLWTFSQQSAIATSTDRMALTGSVATDLKTPTSSIGNYSITASAPAEKHTTTLLTTKGGTDEKTASIASTRKTDYSKPTETQLASKKDASATDTLIERSVATAVETVAGASRQSGRGSFIAVMIAIPILLLKKNLNKGELSLKHALGLGYQPNVIPLDEPLLDRPARPVKVGWHPVGGPAGKWFADKTGLGKMIKEKINKYPDPTQHWAVLVGDFAHQLWMVSVDKCVGALIFGSLITSLKDENFDVIYTNESINVEEWCTFEVGETRFNDDAIRRAGESVIHSIRETRPAYNLISNNCQTYVLQLLDAIKVGMRKEFGTSRAVYERLVGPGTVLELFAGPEESHELANAPLTDSGTVSLAEQVMNENTVQLDTHEELERKTDAGEHKKSIFSRFTRH